MLLSAFKSMVAFMKLCPNIPKKIMKKNLKMPFSVIFSVALLKHSDGILYHNA